jgi:hypothetical protein
MNRYGLLRMIAGLTDRLSELVMLKAWEAGRN